MCESDATQGKNRKRYRSPPPKLEAPGPHVQALSQEEKDFIVDALIQNLVAVVVKRYEATMRKKQVGGSACEPRNQQPEQAAGS